ncbi:DUF6973 domain-containing protein [Emticicia sp. BO119]|uniref:DUF6973 domain-containing protein n=1 Tax=Emticicia sp. BO119 TaxID=2757768 RepID=UPI0015F051FA|nr:hypothetical protein [Emticicia sp. BO119]MBA4851814.1 hypothetical protein [Emticicia sp. BO119]
MSSDIKTNLVFTKVKDKIESFEMRIISEDDYYLKKKKTKLALNDFDGYVYIFDNNKNFVSGLLYQDGKKVGDLGNNIKKSRILDQVEICVDWHSQVCVDGYGCYDWLYTHTTCSTVNIDGSAGSIFTTALEAAMSGGSSSSLSSMLQFPGIQDLWSHLNATEQAYFTAKWWLLPDAYNAYRAAEDYVLFYYCNNNDDGNWNAFKHAFWAAMLSATVGPRTALEITDNHEVGQDAVNQSMDLFNNNLGINTFKQISSQVAAEPIANKKTGIILNAILQKIAQGQGRRLLPENVDISLQTLNITTNANRCR